MNSWLSIRLGYLWCWLWTSHDRSLGVYEQNHWYLRCSDCGYRTTGWQLESKPSYTAMSAEDISQIEWDMLEVELSLHGGG